VYKVPRKGGSCNDNQGEKILLFRLFLYNTSCIFLIFKRENQMLRTHTCAQLMKKNIGEDVKLSGWVSNRRDHGGIIFIDLRDRYGITQVVFDPEDSEESHKLADSFRSEYVIQIE
jgi:lysyl-tRNA synthetase class II